MKISVVIITRNRKEDLRRSLDAFMKQTYENKEIIVLDNASSDGTRLMMGEDFPQIKYLWLPENFDIRTINIGVEMSDGDIIWRTDDDSHPESEFAFQQIVDILTYNPDIDVIATLDVEVRRGNEPWEWYPLPYDVNNVPSNGYQSHFFPGTGAAIRRKVFDKIGGFWEFGFEELDFCSRAILANFSVRFFPNIRVLHYASQSDRIKPDRWVNISRQFMRYNWKYFPMKRLWGLTILTFFSQTVHAIASGIPLSVYFEGIFSMLAVIIHTYRNERVVVPPEKLYDITLGVSMTKAQINYFKILIRNKFKEIWKK